MYVSSLRGEYRIQHAGQFVGTETPGNIANLHYADEVLERVGFARDSLGYVFTTRAEVMLALRLCQKAVQTLGQVVIHEASS